LGDGFRTAVRIEQAMYGQGVVVVVDCFSKKFQTSASEGKNE
jgi:hypothetical protein